MNTRPRIGQGDCGRRVMRAVCLAVLTLAGLVALRGALAERTLPAAEPARQPPRVVLVRGPVAMISGGLDELAKKLGGTDCTCQVVPGSVALSEMIRLARAHDAQPLNAPIVLVGHSLGADLVSRMARELASSHLTIDLLVLIDSPTPTTVPANVRRCVNIYQPTGATGRSVGGIRGAPSVAADPRWTEMVNLNVRDLDDKRAVGRVRHYNIAASPFVHDVVRREVRDLTARETGQPVRITRLPPAPPE